MKIQPFSPISALLNPTRAAGERQPVAAGAANAAKGAGDTVSISQAGQDNLAADIVGKYDLHNASYDDVKKMGRELYDAGAIDGEQYLNLTAPYFDTFDAHLNRTTDTSAKRDYLSGLQGALDFQKHHPASDAKSIAYMEKVVALFKRLDALSLA